MKRFNYYTEEGKRSCFSATETEVEAIRFLVEKQGLSSFMDYIYKQLKVVEKDANFSAFVRDMVIKDLMELQNERK